MSAEIEALIRSVNAKQKDEVLVRGADLKHVTFQRATTGALTLDLMLGGGWPLNCWNEIIGNESSGKTAVTLKTIAANQAMNPDYATLWVASEDFFPEWAEALGVDVDRITFVMTNAMEVVYDAVLQAFSEKVVDAVVIDSYPALVPSDEDDKNMMEFTVGRGALLTNKFMRKSAAAQRRSLIEDERPVLGLFINQWRERIGVIGRADPRITPGGKGKNYSFLTRVDVAREEWITNGAKEKVGQNIKCRTVKNKTAPPQRTANVDFYFDDHKEFKTGDYDITKMVTVVAIESGVIEQRGAWYHFEDEKWNGIKRVVEAVDADPALAKLVSAHVRAFLLHEPLPEKVTTKRRVARPK
jgi:recombination protein RecA